MGLGMALVFVPLQNLALAGVAPHDAGAASATANSTMQIGGSIGLSVFTAVYAAVVAPAQTAGVTQSPALVAGYSGVFVAAAIGMVLASIVAALLLPKQKSTIATREERVPVLHAG
jgi:hypothetical protein